MGFWTAYMGIYGGGGSLAAPTICHPSKLVFRSHDTTAPLRSHDVESPLRSHDTEQEFSCG